MAGRFTLEAIFKGTDRMTRPISKLQAQFGRFTRSVGQGFKDADGMASGFLNGLARVGVAATAAAVVTGAALHDIVTTGAEFEKTMVGAAAKFSPEIRKGTAEFERLRKTAEDVGATTEFNAQQAASGLKDLASAGFKVDQAISALPGVVDLATAAEVELAAASEIASKSLGAFGLKTDDAKQLGINLARVNDNLARTADATSASIEGLFESIKEGAPVAASAGASIETFMALAGQLSEAGIEGSSAGTTLKNVFLSLSAPTDSAAASLKKLGINTRDSKGNLLDAIDILGQLEKATGKMGTADKAAALESIFGKIPIAGVTSLLDAGSDKLRALRGDLEKAGGSTAKMAAIMRDTTQGDIDGFTSAVDGVKIAIFGVVSGPLRDLLKGLSDWTSANREVIATGIKDFIQWIADHLPEIVLWGKRIGIIVGVLTAVAGAIKIVTMAMAAWNAVAALNPVVLAILAVAAALALIIAFWPEISKHFIDVWEGIRAAFEKGFVQGVWETLKQLFIHFSPIVWIARGLDALVEYLFGFSLFDAAGGMVQSFVDGVRAAWTAVVNFFRPSFEFIVGLAALAFMAMKLLWTPVIKLFALLWEGVKLAVQLGWDAIVAVASFYFAVMKAVWMPVIEFFLMLWEHVKTLFAAGWEAILFVATTTLEGLKMIWSPVVDFFAGLWDSVAAGFDAAFGWVLDKLEWAVGAVREVGRGVLGGDDAADGGGQVVSPQDRTARSISEHTDKSSAEVTIKDKTGRAEVTKKPKGKGISLNVAPSGAF
jgi:TP901 family phage tail tape measure protein